MDHHPQRVGGAAPGCPCTRGMKSRGRHASCKDSWVPPARGWTRHRDGGRPPERRAPALARMDPPSGPCGPVVSALAHARDGPRSIGTAPMAHSVSASARIDWKPPCPPCRYRPLPSDRRQALRHPTNSALMGLGARRQVAPGWCRSRSSKPCGALRKEDSVGSIPMACRHTRAASATPGTAPGAAPSAWRAARPPPARR